MKFLLIALLLFVVLGALLLAGQHRMLYQARPYDDGYGKFSRIVEIAYRTGEGPQVAYYLPPADNPAMPPERLWLFFGGNGSLALDWYGLTSRLPDRQSGFLLLDYPGYGRCAGRASPKTIVESAEKGLAVLARHLEVPPAILENRLHVVGHSLGAATCLQFARRHQVRRLVLIAPFTSLKDMAVRVVGKPLSFLVLHKYDNRLALRELMARPARPAVTIFHGDRDQVIPVAMGRELAALYPGMIDYVEVANGGHNGILTSAEDRIFEAMLAAAR